MALTAAATEKHGGHEGCSPVRSEGFLQDWAVALAHSTTEGKKPKLPRAAQPYVNLQQELWYAKPHLLAKVHLTVPTKAIEGAAAGSGVSDT